MNKKCWYGPNGEFKVQPKDKHSGIMISGLQSFKFGFGYPDFQKNKQEINSYQKGKIYHDKEAALKIKKTANKSDLLKDLFVCLF